MRQSTLRFALFCATLCCAAGFTPAAVRPFVAQSGRSAALVPQISLSPRAAAPAMGLFGLGAPEIAICGAVALMLLGPDKLKEFAKEAGKMSADLKQVPEEFNAALKDAEKEKEEQKAKAPTAMPAAQELEKDTAA